MIKKVKQPIKFKTHSQNYWNNLLIFGKSYNREEDLDQQMRNDWQADQIVDE